MLAVFLNLRVFVVSMSFFGKACVGGILELYWLGVCFVGLPNFIRFARVCGVTKLGLIFSARRVFVVFLNAFDLVCFSGINVISWLGVCLWCS